MRKGMSIILIAALFISLFPVFVFTAGSDKVIDIKDDLYNGENYAIAVFNTEATPGTGTVFFGTNGWNISFAGHKFLYETAYVPDTSIDYNIPLVDGSGRTTESVQSRIRRQKGEDSAIYQSFIDLMRSGGTIVFDAHIYLYKIINNEKIRTGDPADTLAQALALANWGPNTKADLENEYYNRQASIDPQPVRSSNTAKADFDIIYKGSVVTSTVTKDPNNLALTLRDKSSVTDSSDPITQRLWYYWSIQRGWELLPTGDNDTEVVIEDMDADLPGSQVLKKAFKLEVYTDEGAFDDENKEAAFRQDTGNITVYYLDLATKEDIYNPDVFLNQPFGTHTKNAKPAPTGYIQVPPTVKSVVLSSTSPNADIYFYYSLQPSGIIVYYRDIYTNEDLYDPDTYDYPFGTYQIEALEAPPNYKLETPSPKQVTLNAENPFVEVVFQYKPDGIVGNRPPVAVPRAATPMYVGDEYSITGSGSYDPEGDPIVRHEWRIGNAEVAAGSGLKIEADGSITGSNGKIWFPDENGYATLTLTVTDSKGASGSDSIKVQVLPPKINLVMDTTGKLKQNRKITMNVSNNSIIPKHYTWVAPEVKYTLTPLNSSLTNIKYNGTLTGVSKDILSKQPMQLKITASAMIELKDGEYRKMLVDEGLTELIPRYAETVERTITIVQDQPPRANLAVPAEIIRNPSDSNYGTFNITNTSTSPDGDPIGKSACLIAYDSNNNGSFDDDTCYYSINGTSWITTGKTYAQIKASGFNIRSLTTANPANYTYKTKEVGDYRFELVVVENIPASETITEFLIDTDYLIDATFN